jgi:phosphoglycerate kinase
MRSAARLPIPTRPMFAVVGGSKVSTKLEVLDRLAELADGSSLAAASRTHSLRRKATASGNRCTTELVDTMRRIKKVEIPIPVDVVMAPAFDASAGRPCAASMVHADEMILDIGLETARSFASGSRRPAPCSGMVRWASRTDRFGDGTRVIAQAIATSSAFSIAGGDTLAAIDKYGVADGISYISTGGGAFLEFVEGKPLPAVEILEARARST